MEIQFVSFTQANALKELGFPQTYNVFGGTTCHYTDNEAIAYHSEIGVYNNVACAAPTLEHAAKFLREEKDFPFYPEFCGYSEHGTQLWACYLAPCNMYVPNETTGYDTFDSFEEALRTGIDKVIDILHTQH